MGISVHAQLLKLFLLGQITLIIQEGKPSRSAERNPSTQVVLQIYNYDAATTLVEGHRSSSPQYFMLMLQDICKEVQTEFHYPIMVLMNYMGIYLPLSEHLDITSRLPSELTDDAASDEDSEEEFIAEQIVKK